MMLETRSPQDEKNRLARLQAFLAEDPDNAKLIADAAEAAYEAQQLEQADELLRRLNALGALSDRDINLSGLVALRLGRYFDAVATFSRLIETGSDNGALRFNLAWANAMVARYEEALAWLDEEALAASPHALRLKVQMLHHLSRFEEGLALGDELRLDAAGHPHAMGALALLAMDAEDIERARSFATLAGDDPTGIAVLGLLALATDEQEKAGPLLDRALALQPDNARAWVGKGLSLLGQGAFDEAATATERGAKLLGTHLGSWIAAGWAHFAAGNMEAARADFEQALTLDANFAESYGGLAVVDIVAGDLDHARQRTQVALRLDRNALGAQLAQILLLEQIGETKTADLIRRKALAAPIGVGGRTLGNALAALALRRH